MPFRYSRDSLVKQCSLGTISRNLKRRLFYFGILRKRQVSPPRRIPVRISSRKSRTRQSVPQQPPFSVLYLVLHAMLFPVNILLSRSAFSTSVPYTTKSTMCFESAVTTPLMHFY